MIMSGQPRFNSWSVQQQGPVEKTQLHLALMNAAAHQRESNMNSLHQVQQATGFASAAPPRLATTKRYFGGAPTTLGPAAKRQIVHGISALAVPQSKGWWKFKLSSFFILKN